MPVPLRVFPITEPHKYPLAWNLHLWFPQHAPMVQLATLLRLAEAPQVLMGMTPPAWGTLAAMPTDAASLCAVHVAEAAVEDGLCDVTSAIAFAALYQFKHQVVAPTPDFTKEVITALHQESRELYSAPRRPTPDPAERPPARPAQKVALTAVVPPPDPPPRRPRY